MTPIETFFSLLTLPAGDISIQGKGLMYLLFFLLTVRIDYFFIAHKPVYNIVLF